MAKFYCTGTGEVLKWLDENADQPYFSIWQGKRPLGSWRNNDKEGGREYLESNLRAFEAAGITDPYILKLHQDVDKDGYISEKTRVYATLEFRPCAAISNSMAGIQMSTGATGYTAILEKLNAMESRMNAMQAEKDLEEEEEEEPAAVGGMEGILMKIFEMPQVQEAIAPAIGSLVQKIFPGSGAPAAPAYTAASMGNLPDQDEKIDNAVDILVQYDDQLGDDLMKLAKIAQTNQSMFQMVLQSLRLYNG